MRRNYIYIYCKYDICGEAQKSKNSNNIRFCCSALDYSIEPNFKANPHIDSLSNEFALFFCFLLYRSVPTSISNRNEYRYRWLTLNVHCAPTHRNGTSDSFFSSLLFSYFFFSIFFLFLPISN